MVLACGIVSGEAAAAGNADELDARLERRIRTLAPEEQQHLRSLLLASASNDAEASYRLYRYYLDRGLDREAIYFETRALDQGYTPPLRLTHRRG